VKVLYGEGIANHTGPESCVGSREAVGEALTGDRAGQPLSREKNEVLGADAVTEAEGDTTLGDSASPGRPGAVKAPGMHGRSLSGNREISGPTIPGEGWSAMGRPPRSKPLMNGLEKSDQPVVAVKSPNTVEPSATEAMERRGWADGNTGQSSTHRAQTRTGVSPGLDRVRKAASRDKSMRLTTLMPHMDLALLRWAYFALKRDAAAGVDGIRWAEYGEGLEDRLKDLLGRLHRGAYRALPSLRRYIPKPDGRKRPLGIAAIEDKIVQRAAVEVMNQIYEGDFLGFSYGFRPGRSQHDALDALCVGITRKRIGYVLDADIAAFFDSISHDLLVEFVKRRIADRRFLHLIQKWLKVGTLEDGRVTPGSQGSPQGAVISPLLANVYLHYVLDLWAHQWREREAGGDMIIVRYADDFVVGFQHKVDAVRFLADLRHRLEEHALALHPDKTRLIAFGRRTVAAGGATGWGKPETFRFLGFTHISGRNRWGNFLLLRKSRRDRMSATLKAIKEGLRRRRHWPVADQGKWLKAVMVGWMNYHAVPTNYPALAAFRRHVARLWIRSLQRRSQRTSTTWTYGQRIIARWLPRPRILHPWPNARFDAKYRRQEPDAGNLHVRICAGGAQQ